jgi:biopolymer transport protein ExbB/TolQ
MSIVEKPRMPKIIDVPLGIGALLCVGYYAVILQEPFHGTLLYRYTAEHLVEYLVVGFFLWGLVDVVFHVTGFPGELLALGRQWLSPRMGREPVSQAGVSLARLGERPQRLLRSRIGQRYLQALAYVAEKGSANDLSEQLRHLADADYEKTQSNYALLRFICWVMPMFGFLGTVVHFGTALAGQTSTSISENLPKVVSEMGTAFNTTTAALAAATTMMFAVFLCERIERGIVLSIDQRVEADLLNRFEAGDASLAPFLDALRSSNQVTLDALAAANAGQLEMASHALGGALVRLEQRFDANDQQRNQRFAQLLQAFEGHAQSQLAAFQPAIADLSDLKVDLARFVDALTTVAKDRKELIELQASLADNLSLLGETRQFDQAVHSLTAAIHLLTARGHTPGEARAA